MTALPHLIALPDRSDPDAAGDPHRWSDLTLGLLRRELERTLGHARARQFLLRYGWLVGYAEASAGGAMRQDSQDFEALLARWLRAREGVRGRVRLLHPGHCEAGIEVVLEQSAEAEVNGTVPGQTAEPACWLTAGRLGGYASALLGHVLMFREVQCRAQGNPVCHLVASPSQELGDLADLLPGSGRPGEAGAPLTFDDLRAEQQRWERARSVLAATLETLSTAGVQAAVAALADGLDAAVCLIDPLLAVRVAVPQPLPGGLAPSQLSGLIQKARKRWEATGDAPGAAAVAEAVPGTPGQKALVLPLADRDGLHGYLVLLHPSLTADEQHVCTLAGRALTLELSKEKVAAAVKVELEGGLLRDLLSGRHTVENELYGRATHLGVHINGPMKVAMVRVTDPEVNLARVAPRLCEHLRGLFGPLLWMVDAGQLVLLLPWAGGRPVRQGVANLQECLEHYLGVQFVAGLSSTCQTPAAYHHHYQELRQVLEFFCAVSPQQRVVELDHLGIYRVLFRLQNREELQAYATTMLEPLIEYDQKREAGLLQTLEAYLDHGGSLKQIARQCHLHINGLKYRLRRISELTGFDLEDARTRLSLQVAIAVHRLGQRELS